MDKLQGILFDDYKVELVPESLDLGGSWELKLRDGILYAYDPDLLRFFFGRMQQYKFPRFLDIGASTGSFSLLSKFHNANVIAFEPAPDTFRCLVRNTRLNGLNIEAFFFAISDRVGDATLKLPVIKKRRRDGVACIGTPKRFAIREEINIKTKTIDSLNLRYVDLIKIDTEGCELLILRGGENTLRKHHPELVFEFSAKNTKQFNYHPDEIITFLKSLGYKAFVKVGLEDIWAI